MKRTKKPEGRKLKLSRETVRRLSTTDLREAVGGVLEPPSGNSDCTACPTTGCTREVTNTCATSGCAGGSGGSGGGGGNLL